MNRYGGFAALALFLAGCDDANDEIGSLEEGQLNLTPGSLGWAHMLVLPEARAWAEDAELALAEGYGAGGLTTSTGGGYYTLTYLSPSGVRAGFVATVNGEEMGHPGQRLLPEWMTPACAITDWEVDSDELALVATEEESGLPFAWLALMAPATVEGFVEDDDSARTMLGEPLRDPPSAAPDGPVYRVPGENGAELWYSATTGEAL